MTANDWDGRHLGDGPLAMAVVTGDPSTGPDLPPLVAAAAHDGGRSYVIRPERLGDFLRGHHAAAWIACHDAGQFFWTVEAHLRGVGNRDALEALWGIARDQRLYDVQLL